MEQLSNILSGAGDLGAVAENLNPAEEVTGQIEEATAGLGDAAGQATEQVEGLGSIFGQF